MTELLILILVLVITNTYTFFYFKSKIKKINSNHEIDIRSMMTTISKLIKPEDFKSCTSLDIDIPNWDISKVTNAEIDSGFSQSKFNKRK